MNAQEQRLAIAEQVEDYILHYIAPVGHASGSEVIDIMVDGMDTEVAFCYSGTNELVTPYDRDCAPYWNTDIDYQGTASVYDAEGDKLYDLPVIGRILN